MFAESKQFAEKTLLHFEKLYLETFQDLQVANEILIQNYSLQGYLIDIFCILIKKKLKIK